MLNYSNYFTEIEERFSQRKGMIHLLSTLDWSLVEIWKDAGIPLDAVLRGIDAAFDHWDKKPERHKVRKVNSLAFCAQEVLTAAQEMASASVGAASAQTEARDTGFEHQRIADYLSSNARSLRSAAVPPPARQVIAQTADELDALSQTVRDRLSSNEEVEQRLTVLEEKVIASLLSATPNQSLLGWRVEAEREMMPYKRKMQAAQISQLTQQFIHKRLLESSKVPRLSLFYLF